MRASPILTRTSAALLGAAGALLLFAADTVLPAAVPGVPPGTAWLGQLVGAGWLAVASFNWNSRAAILGGIYGRPIVLLNLFLYLVSGLTLARAAHGATALLVAAGVAAIMGVAYAVVLLRGPFDPAPGS